MADNHSNTPIGIIGLLICWATAILPFLAKLDLILSPLVKIISILAGVVAIYTFCEKIIRNADDSK